MYSKQDIELIRSKVDILQYLEDQGLSFQHSGSTYKGLCPIHNERTPSFHVTPLRNSWHCFGCGEGGDIFSLVQQMEQMTFVGAVQELAEYANIEIKDAEEDEAFKKRQRLYQVCDITAAFYRHEFDKLPEAHPAKQNLAQRNLLHADPENPDAYSAASDPFLGYAGSKGLIDLLLKARYSLDEIIEAGLAVPRENSSGFREKFRDRLMWTVTDVQGRPVGFTGRILTDEAFGPKYLNSPQTPLYNKSRTLLNLSSAKKEIVRTQKVYVVEGQTDVMALRAAGYANTVASCGTAFGTEHTSILNHLSNIGKGSDHFKMVFFFDGDGAGIKAAKKVFEANKSMHLNSFVVKLEGADTDPCDFRKNQGDEALRNVIENKQVNIIEFILKEELNNWEVTTPEGQSGFIKKAREVLSLIEDPIQFSYYVRKVALWTGLSYQSLTNSMKQSSNNFIKPAGNEAASATTLVGAEKTIIALAFQSLEDIKPYIDQYKIDTTFFPVTGKHGQEMFTKALNGEIDYSNREISELLHIDLKVAPERKDDIIKNIVRSFLKSGYTTESSNLNARIASLSDDNVILSDPNLLQEVFVQQAQLKQKYSI
jgi:DNA primase